MGASESLGVTPRLRDIGVNRPTEIWALAVTDSNRVKVDFTPNCARQCQFANDWIFEADIGKRIDDNHGFILLFDRTRIVKATSDCRNDTVRVTAEIQRNIGPYLDEHTGAPMGTTQFSILWGDHIFNVTGVSGRVYLWWASEISSYQREPTTGMVSSRVRKMGTGTPLLVHTNAHFELLHVCPLMVFERRVQFISATHFKLTQYLSPFTPIFEHDTTPAHHSPRLVLLTEDDVRARRERQILPAAERTSFGIQHKKIERVKGRRRRKFDNTEFSNEEEEKENEDHYDDDGGDLDEEEEATLVEELESKDAESLMLTDNVQAYFDNVLQESNGDSDNDDDASTVTRATDDEKTMGNDLEWDEDVFVRQNATRMVLKAQHSKERHHHRRRSQAKAVSTTTTTTPPSSQSITPASSISSSSSSLWAKGKEKEEEEGVDNYDAELKLEGKKYLNQGMFGSSSSSGPVVNPAPTHGMKSARHAIPMQEGGRTNQTYTPILRSVVTAAK